MLTSRSRRIVRAVAGVAAVAGLVVIPVPSASADGSDTVDEIHASFGDDAGTSMWVGWHGPASGLNYGPDASYGQSATPELNPVTPVDIGGPFEHVLLTGLTPGTVYHYQIDFGADHEFETAPTGDFTWDDIGDTTSTYDSYDPATRTGCNATWMSSVWTQLAAEQPDFVTHGGDLTYANECGVSAVHQFFDDIAPIATMRAWEQTWGNHEYGAPTSDAPPGTPRDSMANYKGRFYLANPQAVPVDTPTKVSNPGCPAPGASNVNGCLGQDWGYFTAGHVLIIEYPEPWGGALTAWGTAADSLMAAAQADPNISFIVTTGHRPAYSGSTSQVAAGLKPVLDGLGEKYSPAARPDGKYLLNIAHHVHAGEVFAPQHGVVHITNGGGGTAESSYGGGSPALFHTSHSEHLRIAVTGATMHIDMVCGPPVPKARVADACVQGSTLYSLDLPEDAQSEPPPQPVQWVTNPGLDGGSKYGWTGVYNSYSRLGVSQDATGNWRLQIGTTSRISRPAGVNNPSPFWVNNASVAGTTYTATAQAVPSVTGKKAYLLLRETTPAGAAVGSAQSAVTTLTNTGTLTQLPGVSYRAARSGDSIRYSLVTTNLVAGQLLCADDFGLTSPP